MTNTVHLDQAFAPNANGPTETGGAVLITGGYGGSTSGAGGRVDIKAGNAVANGPGGPLYVQSGSGVGDGSGGYLQIRAGDNLLGTGGWGGSIGILGGYATGNGYFEGGSISIIGGLGGGYGTGGGIYINAGYGGSVNGAGGPIFIQGGTVQNTTANTVGGPITLKGGISGGTVNGGLVTITGGDAYGSAANGGGVLISGGNAIFNGHGGTVTVKTANAVGSGNNNNGGDFKITLGSKTASGRNGQVIITSLPTADPLVAGALWSNSGAIRVSSG